MIKLNPDQKRALELVQQGKRHMLIYGGSRSGKTFLIVYLIVLRALKYGGSRHLIYRLRQKDAIESIWLETLPKVLSEIGLNVSLYQTNETRHVITFKNGSEIWIAGVDDSRSADSVLGKEYATIYHNEASQIPFLTAWKVRTRLAQAVAGCAAREFVDLNPTSRGHWTYKEYVALEDPIESKPGHIVKLPNPQDYAYIQINPAGNVQNLDPAYIQSLAHAPEQMRRRFYLGEYADDNELTVFAFPPEGFYGGRMFEEWVAAVGPGNVRLTAGLDLGFEDADGFAVVAYVPRLTAPEGPRDIMEALRKGIPAPMPSKDLTRKRWLIYEYKARRSGLKELADAVGAGLKTVERRCLDLGIPYQCSIYSDTGGGGAKMVYDLRTQHHLPVRPAYKRDKLAAIELLQDEVKAGSFVVPADGAFAQEAEAIVWTKDPDTGAIVRTIDDKVYHPDMMDAVLYAMRSVWVNSLAP